uniref:Uncharacterized protein n=1 Tax=Glossina palpalis gambiensis TaxID=67801 RepID=A0A1B0BHQ6_9MUSC
MWCLEEWNAALSKCKTLDESPPFDKSKVPNQAGDIKLTIKSANHTLITSTAGSSFNTSNAMSSGCAWTHPSIAGYYSPVSSGGVLWQRNGYLKSNGREDISFLLFHLWLLYVMYLLPFSKSTKPKIMKAGLDEMDESSEHKWISKLYIKFTERIKVRVCYRLTINEAYLKLLNAFCFSLGFSRCPSLRMMCCRCCFRRRRLRQSGASDLPSFEVAEKSNTLNTNLQHLAHKLHNACTSH